MLGNMRMKITIRHIILLSLTILFACKSTETSENREDKKTILHASREAPLGWLYFELYSDSSFKATSAGLRDADKYHGTYQLHFDTLFLTYKDSIPKAFGKEILIENHNLRFLDIPGGLPINKTTIDYEKLIENKPIDSLEIAELKLIQGIWKHSKDEKAVVSIRQNFWTDYYDNQPITEKDDYRIRWTRKLPEYVDSTVNSSFLVLTNKKDTLNYEILGATDSTLSLMYFPTGRIHHYRKKK
jgi:hypothetical protein